MKTHKAFSTSKSDAQATVVEPVKVFDFCFNEYAAYPEELSGRCSAFDIDYIQSREQAPATKSKFQTIDKELAHQFKQVKETPVEHHSLNMFESIQHPTKRKLPLSFSDSQSPFNNATNIVYTSNFLIPMIIAPENILQFFDLQGYLMIDYYREQEKLIISEFEKDGKAFGWPVFHSCGNYSDKIELIKKNEGLKQNEVYKIIHQICN